MGLDISIVERREVYSFRAGSYSGFGKFREFLASAVGIDLLEMEGFGGQKKWEGTEPLFFLLEHSDCDGLLHSFECKKLLDDFNNNQTKIATALSKIKDKEQRGYYKGLIGEWLKALKIMNRHDNMTLEFC